MSTRKTNNPINAKQRRQRALLANDVRWSQTPHDKRLAQTAAARAAVFAKYLRQVDPDGVLPEGERDALARQARRADLRRMALKASRARTARARGEVTQ
jgi:hypothetical protein